jgi:hypothetical protein
VDILMPFYELIIYLHSIGDTILYNPKEWLGCKLTTKNGLVYVYSIEGRTFDGNAWHDKYRWNRI